MQVSERLLINTEKKEIKRHLMNVGKEKYLMIKLQMQCNNKKNALKTTIFWEGQGQLKYFAGVSPLLLFQACTPVLCIHQENTLTELSRMWTVAKLESKISTDQPSMK